MARQLLPTPILGKGKTRRSCDLGQGHKGEGGRLVAEASVILSAPFSLYLI